MPALRSFTTAGLVAGVIAAAAGCGNSGSSTAGGARGQFDSAITALANSDAVTAVLRLDATAAQLEALPNPPNARTAQLIVSANVTIEVKTVNGAPLSSVKPPQTADADVQVTVAGNPLVEVRSVANTLYARADVPALLQIAGKSASALTPLESRIPPSLTWAHAALSGDWISLDLSTLRSLLGGGASPSTAQSTQLLNQLRAVLDRDVTFTNKGNTALGDHIVLSGSIRQIGTDIYNLFAAQLSKLPLGSSSLGSLNPSRLPNRTVSLDAYVQNGVLSELSLDLSQFAPQRVPQHIPLVIDFSTTGSAISAPAGAVPVDLSGLGSLFSGLGGSGATGL